MIATPNVEFYPSIKMNIHSKAKGASSQKESKIVKMQPQRRSSVREFNAQPVAMTACGVFGIYAIISMFENWMSEESAWFLLGIAVLFIVLFSSIPDNARKK